MRNSVDDRRTSAAHIDLFDLMEMNNGSSNVSNQGPSMANKIKKPTTKSPYSCYRQIDDSAMHKLKR